MQRSVHAISVTLVIAVSAVLVGALSYHYWDALKGMDSASATIRNIGLVGGGLVAIGLALWRSAIAQRQVQVAEEDSLDNQFQKAAEMLGHQDLYVRLGGVISLYHLGSKHLDRYGYQVCNILDKFSSLRRSTKEDGDNHVTITVSGVGGPPYQGPPDGGEAYTKFWELQKEIGQFKEKRNRRRKILRRLLRRIRRALSSA